MVYKLKYKIWCANRTFHVPKIPVYRLGLYGSYQILWTDIAHCSTDLPKANRGLFAKFEVRSSLRSDAVVITTDRHSSNVLEFCADQMSPRKLCSDHYF